MSGAIESGFHREKRCWKGKGYVSRHNSDDVHMNSQKLTACARPAQIQDRQNPSMEKDQWMKKNPTTDKRPICNWYPLREKNQFSPMEWHGVYQPYFKFTQCPELIRQHKTDSILGMGSCGIYGSLGLGGFITDVVWLFSWFLFWLADLFWKKKNKVGWRWRMWE